MPGIERLTAIKCTLKEVNSGKYFSGTEKFDPNYVESSGLKLSRINVIATITAVYMAEDKKYAFIVLDDGTAVMRSKAFQDTKTFASLKKGDLICFIGKVREYNDERYLVPEIVKKLDDPNFETLRKLELLKRLGVKVETNDSEPEPQQKPIEPKKQVDKVAQREQILKIIAENDSGEGVSYDKILQSVPDSESVLNELLEEGSCYEPRPGKIKLL